MLAMRRPGGNKAALCLFATVLAAAGCAAAPGLTEWSLNLNPQGTQGGVTGAPKCPHAVLPSVMFTLAG